MVFCVCVFRNKSKDKYNDVLLAFPGLPSSRSKNYPTNRSQRRLRKSLSKGKKELEAQVNLYFRKATG